MKTSPYLPVAFLLSSACATVQQEPITKDERAVYFDGATSNAHKQSLLTLESSACASHQNRLRSQANAIYIAKNSLTALGLIATGVGAGIAAANKNSPTPGIITTVSGVAVTALTQFIVTVFADPANLKAQWTSNRQYWIGAEQDTRASTPDIDDAINKLSGCHDDTPPVAPTPPRQINSSSEAVADAAALRPAHSSDFTKPLVATIIPILPTSADAQLLATTSNNVR